LHRAGEVQRLWCRGRRPLDSPYVQTLAYLAATMVALWGLAHAVPTRRVITGFMPISTDNRRVLTRSGWPKRSPCGASLS
jgi:hypothetical protein